MRNESLRELSRTCVKRLFLRQSDIGYVMEAFDFWTLTAGVGVIEYGTSA